MIDLDHEKLSADVFPDPIDDVKNSVATFRISLWLLRLVGETPEYRLVYGNVLKSQQAPPEDQWRHCEVARWGRKRRLYRYSIHLSGPSCHALLAAVLAGPSIQSALDDTQLVLPLRGDSDLSDIALRKLPPAFFSGSTALYQLHEFAWPRTSFVNNHSCFCTRLVRENRFSFLPHDNDEARTTLQDLSVALRPETGLDFGPGAADAFGCIEVYSFPSLDEQEDSRVSVRYEQSPNRSVRVRVLGARPDDRFAMQVRVEQVGDITFDELVFLEGGLEISRDLPEPSDGVELRIWKLFSNERWTLWHEQEDHFLRSIGMSMQLQGLSGEVGASWLDRVPKKLQSRVEKFRTIRQVTMDVPSEMSTREPWETGIMNARKFVRETTPRPSKSRFFKKGVGSDENKFAFAEWLKDRLSSAGCITLVDPYFDVLGLDLICRASGAAKELVVLTCTQAESADDNSRRTRADRLQEVSKTYLPILQGLNLKIVDLGSKDSTSKERLFHDRYLLLYDREGNIREGYNLSTSLQSAATTTPLLVTEIAADVLDDVADYVAELLKPSDKWTVESIFPTIEVGRKRRSYEFSARRAAGIVAALKASGRSLPTGDPIQQVTALGLFHDEKVRFEFSTVELNRVVSALLTLDLKDAADVWDGFVESAVSNWYGGIPETITTLLAGEYRGGLADFLVKFLLAHASGELGATESHLHNRTIGHSLGLPFHQAITEATRFYDHHHDRLGSSWAIRLALIFIIQLDANTLDKLVEQVLQTQQRVAALVASEGGPREKRPPKEDLLAVPGVQIGSAAILSEVIATLTWFVQHNGPQLPGPYAKSEIPFARALWSVEKLRRVLNGDLESSRFLEDLTALKGEERRLVLGQGVYDLRIADNQARSRSEDAQGLPPWLVQAIVDEAASPSTIDELYQLVAFYSGPVVGNWAQSTHNELLLPLVRTEKATEEALFGVWNKLLDVRMQDEYVSDSDLQVVQVWGYCVWSLPEDRRLSILQSDERVREHAERTLVEPFLASRDPQRWSTSATKVAWILLRTWAVVHHAPAGSPRESFLASLSATCSLVERKNLVMSVHGNFRDMVKYVLEDREKTR